MAVVFRKSSFVTCGKTLRLSGVVGGWSRGRGEDAREGNTADELGMRLGDAFKKR